MIDANFELNQQYSAVLQFDNILVTQSSEDLLNSEDCSTEGGEDDGSIRSDTDFDDSENPEVFEGSSGRDMSVDNNDDFGDMLRDRWDDQSSQEEKITYTRESSGDNSGGLGDVNESDSSNNNDGYIEHYYDDSFNDYDSYEYDEPESGETEYISETRETSGSGTIDEIQVEFYNRNLESLGIIAGCLYFLCFVVILKGIYKFFRMFI